MRKIYFLLLFVLLGIVANAQETTLSSTFTGYKNGEFITSENELNWTIDKTLGYLNYSGGKGIQFGSSNNPANEYTFQTNEVIDNVSKVEVTVCVAKSGSASISVFVGENQLGNIQEFSSTDFETFTFEGATYTGNIALKMNGKAKAHYINKVVVYYSDGGSEPLKVSTPTFSLAEGTYNDVQTVELSCSTEKSTITFKVNDDAEQTYSEPIVLSENGTYTITAWANADGLEQSEVATVTYTIEKACSEPNFSLKAGSYIVAQTLELTCETADAKIMYTVNDEPAQVYGEPVVLDKNGTFTIKAWAEKEGYANSAEVTREYVLDIVEGLLVEDFDFVSIGETNGYPTGTNDGTESFVSGDVNVSTTQEGTTANRFWDNWTEYRMYKGATLTFTVPENYTMVRIELFASKSDVSGDGYAEGVWSGESQSVTLNIAGSTTFTDFIVYYKPIALEQVSAPEFSLNTGTYEGEQKLVLTCPTDGSTIHYTVNGGEEQVYSDVITLTVGEYEIIAWATKEGMSESERITRSYEITELVGVSSVSNGQVKVYGMSKSVVIISENKVAVRIYNMVGQLINNMILAEGESQIALLPGIYLVQVNNDTTVKVVVK